jgi:hypothetical protein
MLVLNIRTHTKSPLTRVSLQTHTYIHLRTRTCMSDDSSLKSSASSLTRTSFSTTCLVYTNVSKHVWICACMCSDQNHKFLYTIIHRMYTHTYTWDACNYKSKSHKTYICRNTHPTAKKTPNKHTYTQIRPYMCIYSHIFYTYVFVNVFTKMLLFILPQQEEESAKISDATINVHIFAVGVHRRGKNVLYMHIYIHTCATCG